MRIQAEGPNIIYEVAPSSVGGHASTALWERGPPAWDRPFKERTVFGFRHDERVSGAGDLRGYGGHGFAPEVAIVGIALNVAAVLVTEAVLTLADGDLAGHPERAAQPRIAIFRPFGLAAELSRLMSGEIEAAKLQELAVMAEAPEIAGFGEDSQSVDGADAGDLLQARIIGMIAQQRLGGRFNSVTLANETEPLLNHEAEHGDRWCVRVDRQADRRTGGLVHVAEEARLGDFAADEIPRLGDKGFLGQSGDAGRRGEAMQQREKPCAARVAGEAGDLGEIERQIVGEDTMPKLGLGARHHIVGLRQFLDVVYTSDQRIDICLHRPDPHHVQHDLRVLGVVLVPAVVQSLACAGEGDRGDEAQFEPGLDQTPRERSVVVPGRLKADQDRALEACQRVDKPVVIGARVENGEPAPAACVRMLDEHLVAYLRNVDGYQNGPIGRSLVLGHGRRSPGVVDTHHGGLNRRSGPLFPMCYGPEFVAIAVRTWLARLGVKTLFIEPGSPWENGYCESFNGKLRDEFLAREIFYTLKEAQVLIEWWRRHYNRLRPHSSLGYRPPAPAAILPPELRPAYVLPTSATAPT